MFYEKKIGYLEYRENGERVHNTGFVKIEVKSDRCNLQIQVSKLPILDKLTRKILIQSDKKETCLGEIILQDGGGSFRMREEDAANLGQSGIRYDELTKIVIVIGTGRELVCNWRKETAQEGTADWKQETEPGQTEEQPQREERIWKEEQMRKEVPKKEKTGPMDVQAAELRFNDAAVKDEGSNEGSLSDKRTCRSPRRLQLYEDKWKQLSSIYPHVTPFQDEREYLSISPADFVILQRQYHRLVSNSFLLHGFYNYDHLILARVERAGAVRYYVGVPGNFYDQERQIAIMFGFESFECKREPVEEGDFGYYCIRVDL